MMTNGKHINEQTERGVAMFAGVFARPAVIAAKRWYQGNPDNDILESGGVGVM